MQFAALFKLLCKEKGVTQKQALSDMRLGRNATQRWIDSWPSFETISKMTSYFSVSADVLSQCLLSDDDDFVRSLFLPDEIHGDCISLQKEKPADQKASGLRDAGYDMLTPENKEVIDSLIAKLLKSQSVE